MIILHIEIWRFKLGLMRKLLRACRNAVSGSGWFRGHAVFQVPFPDGRSNLTTRCRRDRQNSPKPSPGAAFDMNPALHCSPSR